MNIYKSPLAVEDVYFGFGTAVQPRGTVTLFNAAYLPYSVSQSVTQGLDDRYTKAQSDAKYALMAGDALVVFKAADGVLSDEVVNVSQLALKADQSDVDLKANKADVLEKTNSTSYIPLSDYNPATKRYVDESIYNKFIFGANGTFTSADSKIITVTNGLITGIA